VDVYLSSVFFDDRRRVISDWMFAGGMLVLSIESLLNGVIGAGTSPDRLPLMQTARLITLAFIPGFWICFSMTYARGHAAASLRRSRWLLMSVSMVPVLFALIVRHHLVALPTDGATGSEIFRLGVGGSVIYLYTLVASVAVLMNLERTFRASVGTMRWRIKFMLLGVGVLFVVRLYTTSQALLFTVVDPALEALNSAALVVAAALILLSLLRARRFALDVYPSQSVLQGSVTILLAGVYLLTVGLFAKVVAYFGGDTSFALKAFVVLIGLVVLAIVLQSDRARLFLRRFVSRNFERPVYDYRTVWRKFTEGTALCVKQEDLCRALVKIAAEMFQALSVTIWIYDGRKQLFVLGASTSISEAKAGEEGPSAEESRLVLEYWREKSDPADIELTDTDWAEAIRRWHPSVFPKGGHRVCLPLAGRDELLGLIVLGDRVAGAEFSVQDFDMLRCVGDHAAANMLNVQLSEKLVEAKELEAFQTMATFFVHDLKNAASTLKLMLQNLPVHFDDPEFRADALRGTAKTVGHIDNLITRLGSLRNEVKLKPSIANLNDVITNVLEPLEKSADVVFERNLLTLPTIFADSEQIGKVVTNLVLNALEASPARSPVKISTSAANGWVMIAVSDQGAGMSREFLSNSLFRPFQTTKKSGLGIGMFQSKAIIDAHSGRISVQSEVGRGTTFEISLPVSKS
jgi:putative PEP-CTERM system histidine kinase